MDINKFVADFAAQFDETDVAQIQSQTFFKDLDEWSSMIALATIAMVDDEYGVKIKGDDLRQQTTVEDLFNLVKSRC